MYKFKEIMIILIAISMFCGCEKTSTTEGIIVATEEADAKAIIEENNEICVYIVGEVVNPGVYNVTEGSRVYDVVSMAGGLTENAALEYINLAGRVSDEEKIIVYSLEQVLNGEVMADEESALININKATKEQLMTLPGIGESRAEAIIKYREDNGGFASKEDIMKVSGIKEAAFSKIEDFITVK